MPLEEYKDLVGSAAAIATIGQQFAPAFICYDIIKQGSTKNIDRTPFLGIPMMSVLMLQHGMMLQDSAMIVVNVCSIALSVIYLALYYAYTIDPKELSDLKRGFGKAMAFAVALIAYAKVDEKERAEFYFGTAVTLTMFSLIAAPLLGVKEIIETKSSAKLPAPLILSGTVVSGLWLLYGIILNNIFLLAQNVVALGLCAIQVALLVIYPSKPAKDQKKE